MPLTQPERNELLRRLRELEARIFPDDPADLPPDREEHRLRDIYYQLFAEYGDRLPRVVMGICPFTAAPLKRALDPFGMDGPWWWMDRPFDIEEPAAPETFKVLLGAVGFAGRNPTEATEAVIPGPEVPFVVPRLLGLPGMTAVISRLELPAGDIAYPISYWSREAIPAANLHQPWLRQDLWFDNGQGSQSWLIATDPWDFDLERWIAAGKLFWIEPNGNRVLGRTSGTPCPYLNLPGDRAPQHLVAGERSLLDLPDGTPISPFEDADEDEEEEEEEEEEV